MPDMIRMTPPIVPQDQSGRVTGAQTPPAQQQINNIVDPGRVARPDGREAQSENRPGQFARGLESNFERFFAALKGIASASSSYSEMILTRMGNVATSSLSENFASLVSEYFDFIKMDESEMLAFIKTLASSSSKFSGPFFDVLRNVMASSAQESTKLEILNFMRVYDSAVSGNHIINNLIINLGNILSYIRPQHKAQFAEMIKKLTEFAGKSQPEGIEDPPRTANQTGRADQGGRGSASARFADNTAAGASRNNAAQAAGGQTGRITAVPGGAVPAVTSEQVARGMTPEQLASVMTPEQIAVSVTPGQLALVMTPEQIIMAISPEQLAEIMTPEQTAVLMSPEYIAAGTILEQIAAVMTPEQAAAGITPEQIAATLTPEQIISGTSPERLTALVTPERIIGGIPPEQIAGVIMPEQLAALITPERIIAGMPPEQVAAVMTPGQIAAAVTPEGIAALLTPEQIAAVITPEQIAAVITPEQTAAGLSHEQVIAAMTPAQIAEWITPEQIASVVMPEQIVAAMTSENAEAMQQTGMQQTGMQQTGMQQTGMQQTGMQQTGMQQTGMQQTETHPAGMPQTEVIPAAMPAESDSAPMQSTLGSNEFDSAGAADYPQNESRAANLNYIKKEILPFISKYISTWRDFGSIRDHVTLLTLNLARYESGTSDEFRSALERLMSYSEIGGRLEGASVPVLAERLLSEKSESEFSELFSSLIERGVRGEGGFAAKEIFDNIMNAFLLNKSVYMPLLHVMIPADVDGKLFFSEMWIDPACEDEGGGGGYDGGGEQERAVKLFVKFDIKDVGFFELIMLNRGKDTDLRIFYPQSLAGREAEIRSSMNNIISSNGLQPRSLTLEKFTRSNTLNEVFPKIYNGKNSINVKV